MSLPAAQLALAGADAALLQGPGREGTPGLSDLDALPVQAHVAVFTAVHERLQRELAAVDAL